MIKKIKFEISVILQWINFKLACRKAMHLHKLTGKQYFVMAGNGTKFIVMDNSKKDLFNKAAKKLGVKTVTYVDLLKQCYFKTPSGTTKARHEIKKKGCK